MIVRIYGTALKMTQVKGFEITGIEAQRFSKTGERLVNIRIEQNSSVTRITKSEGGTASVEFRFTTNYAGIGFIKLEGQIILQGEVERIIEEWNKKGSMPDDIANIVHNVVVSNCVPTALLISRDLRLPPPIPLPKINIQKRATRGPGDSVEVA